ncbi:MAG: recombinase family protein [Mollicutes bacterium]|nr:recombinase family protein [Mollicutes bacterium]
MATICSSNWLEVVAYFLMILGSNSPLRSLGIEISYVRKGDTVVVESISRFARNTKDLLSLIDILKEKDVEFVSKKENIDTSSPTGKFMLTVFGAMAELEREYILQRQAEGIEIAKKNGKYKGRKKIAINGKFKKVYEDWKAKNITATKAMELLGMKRNTFYRRVKEYEAEQGN